MFSFSVGSPWPVKLGNLNLFGIETENNQAIVYTDFSYQPQFETEGGINPFEDVILAHEILRSFRLIVNYEDLFALWWAHTKIYEFTKDESQKEKAQNLETALVKKHGKRWARLKDDTRYERPRRALIDKLWHDYINPTDGFPNYRERAEKMMAYLSTPWQEEHMIDGIAVNWKEHPAEELSILQYYLTESFPQEQLIIFYDAWCESGEERFLKKYLDRFEQLMRVGYPLMPYLSDSYPDDVEGLLHALADEVNIFFKQQDELLNRWGFSDEHGGEWEPGEEEYLPLPGLINTYGFTSVLTADCLAAFLKSSFNLFFSFYSILHRLYYAADDKDKRSALLGRIHDLEKHLDMVSAVLYRKRLRLKDVEKKRIRAALIMLINNIDLPALQENYRDELRRLFDMKKAIGSLIATSDEEIENLLITIVDKLAAAVVTRCKDPSFHTIDRNLRKELGSKVGLLTDDAWRSLVTAEYLYTIFIVDKPVSKGLMDYSFISILYYRALEDVLNNRIYIPYLRGLPDNIKTRAGTAPAGDEKLDPYIPRDSRRALYKGWGKGAERKWTLRRSLTLGAMGHFLYNGAQGNASKMIAFMAGQINEKEKAKELLKMLGAPLCRKERRTRMSIADRRNRAAHGGTIINSEDATVDKRNVYTVGEATKYRRLLKLLLDAFPATTG